MSVSERGNPLIVILSVSEESLKNTKRDSSLCKCSAQNDKILALFAESTSFYELESCGLGGLLFLQKQKVAKTFKRDSLHSLRMTKIFPLDSATNVNF